MEFKFINRLLPALAGSLLLGACSSVSETLFANSDTSFACPDIQIIEDGKEVTFFRPGFGRDIIDVQFEAIFADVTAECSYDRDNGEITMVVQYVIEANRGPAAEGDTLDIPYFIAIVTKDQKILARKAFETQALFKTGHRRTRFVEEIEQVIKVRDNQQAGHYEILASFLLNAQQLKYNREKRLR